MQTYETISLDATPAGVAIVTLNRPDKHNAFNALVVQELADAFDNLRAETQLRMVILRGNGKSFSAGADLKWMKAAADYTRAENEEDAFALAEMLRALYELPQMSRTSRGRALPNVINLEQGETLETCFAAREFPEDRFLLFATAKGQVKKTVLSAYGNVRQGGIKAIKLAHDDRLIRVMITGGEDEILLATRRGQAIRFNESDVRAMGRDTVGVSGINLAAGDEVVSVLLREPTTGVLSVCENGNGKRTGWDEYRLTRRGGKGVININTDRNGPVVASIAVLDDDEIICTSRSGMVVRTRVEDIRVTGRAASGVRVVNLGAGDGLIAVARCAREDDDDLPGDAPIEDAPAPGGDPASPPPAIDDGVPGVEEPEDHGGPDDF